MGAEYLSIEDAEKIAGKRLDRRRKYFIWMGDVCFNEKYTGACSGCSDDSEYAIASIGGGCFECGYTGKRISFVPVPIKFQQLNRG